MDAAKKRKADLSSLDPTKKSNDQVAVVFRLPTPVKVELMKEAQKQELSLNSLVIHALIEFLKRTS